MGLDMYFWKIKRELFDEDIPDGVDSIFDTIYPMPPEVDKAMDIWLKQIYDLKLIKSTFEDIMNYDFIICPDKHYNHRNDYYDIGNQEWLWPMIPNGTSGYGIDEISPIYTEYQNKRDAFIEKEREEWLYFRKANHIHNWFVRNLQHGKDDCKAYKITKPIINKLKIELKSACNNKKASVTYFPICKGFFFGNYDYCDDFYMRTLRDLYDRFENIFDAFDFENYNLYYQSDW